MLFLADLGCGKGGSSRINSPFPVSVQVSGLSNNLSIGQVQQLNATAVYSDASTKDVTATAVWMSDDVSVATVAPGGVLTAKGSGQCSVRAKLDNAVGALQVSVKSTLVSISVTPASALIAINTNQHFTAIGTYSDGSTRDITSLVTWQSPNSAVATTSKLGVASGIGVGTSNITATMQSITGSSLLTVSSAVVSRIAITPLNASVSLGRQQQFTATGTFSDGTLQDISDVVHWNSSNTWSAPITTSGVLNARLLGTFTITAAFEGHVGNTSVVINTSNIASVAISVSPLSIAQGTKAPFDATATYNDGSTYDVTLAAVWSSDNPGVLAIAPFTGLANGVAAGQANVTVTLGALTATVPYTVTNATITSIAVIPKLAAAPVGGRVLFAAMGTFSDGSLQNITDASAWSTDNPQVATVGNTPTDYGVSVGIAAGTANISAQFGYAGATATGTTPITVSGATLASIAVSPSASTLVPGSTVSLTASGTFTDGTKQRINPLCLWASSDNTIATVTSTGQVTGQSDGVATIAAQDGPVIGTATVLVESGTLSSILIAPQTATVPNGFSTGLHSFGTFNNGDIQDITKFVMWTSSNPGVATVSNSAASAGQALGTGPGTTTISGSLSGQTGTATLNVSSATLASIVLSPSSSSINVGQTQSFTATGTFSDGSTLDITNKVVWASSTTSVATINSGGVVQAVAPGSSTISAVADGVTGLVVVTVQ